MCRNHLLVVESRRASFIQYVLGRTDIDVTLLRLPNKRHMPPIKDIPDRVMVFEVDGDSPIEVEAEKFKAWAAAHDFFPTHFCNPSEHLQEQAQEFARLLGFPHLSPEQVELVRSKPAMKEAFLREGIPSAKYRRVHRKDDILEFAEEIEFPLIVKPIDLDSCMGAVKLRNRADFDALSLDDQYSWMVEEYIAGDEYQLCALLHGGEVVEAFVSTNPAPIIETLDGAINANITLAPHEKPPIDATRLVRKIAAVAGLDRGYFHAEFFFNPERGLVMGEIAARLSGNEVPTNHGLAYGFDIFDAILQTYLGRRPAPQYQHDRSVGDLLLPTGHGIVREVSSEAELMRLPGVMSAKVDVSVGEVLAPKRASSSCSGYVHVEGRNAREVKDRMQNVLDNYRLKISKNENV